MTVRSGYDVSSVIHLNHTSRYRFACEPDLRGMIPRPGWCWGPFGTPEMPRYIAPDVGQLDSSVNFLLNGRIDGVSWLSCRCRSQASMVSNELQPGSIILTSAPAYTRGPTCSVTTVFPGTELQSLPLCLVGSLLAVSSVLSI